MSDLDSPQSEPSPGTPILERITGGVLLLVSVALAWIILASRLPAWADWIGLELQVTIIIALLAAALLLVSIVALLHTRK